MFTRLILVTSLACTSVGCLASTIAESIQKGSTENHRHQGREKELAIKEKEVDANAKIKSAEANATKRNDEAVP